MGKKRMSIMMIIVIYVLFSVSGLILLKIGTTRSFSLELNSGNIKFEVNVILLMGLCLYLAAFITSLIAMKSIELSVFYPLSAGMGYVFVCLLSCLILKESITKEQLIGMLFILVGVVLMNIKKG